MPNKPDKLFTNLIKKLRETSVKPKVLHETENEIVEEYTLPIDFIIYAIININFIAR